MVVEHGQPLMIPSMHNCKTLFQPKDWFEYFEKKRNDFTMSPLIGMAPVVQFITDGLSCILTVHHLLPKLTMDNANREKLVLHIVGAASVEQIASKTFPEIARLNPHLKHIEIVLIGPGIDDRGEWGAKDGIDLNSSVYTQEGEELLNTESSVVKCFKGLYHDIFNSSEMTPPDLIVAFNAGISGPSHYVNWRPTLGLIKEMGVPLIITGFNREEVESDTQVLHRLGHSIIVQPTPNPFRGLRPYRDPLPDPDDFYWANACYVCLKG